MDTDGNYGTVIMKGTNPTATINNGNRTTRSPLWSVIIRVINKMQESDMFNHELLIITLTKFEKKKPKV